MHMFRHRSSLHDPDGNGRAAKARDSLRELNECWEKLEGQVEDKQARLEAALHFQQLYQDAMLNMSAWLDDIELRLFETPYEKDVEQHLKDNEVSDLSSP